MFPLNSYASTLILDGVDVNNFEHSAAPTLHKNCAAELELDVYEEHIDIGDFGMMKSENPSF